MILGLIVLLSEARVSSSIRYNGYNVGARGYGSLVIIVTTSVRKFGLGTKNSVLLSLDFGFSILGYPPFFTQNLFYQNDSGWLIMDFKHNF